MHNFLILSILFVAVKNVYANSISQSCDCGFIDNSNNWNEMWFMDYEEKNASNTYGGSQYLYKNKDLFISNYDIPPKFNDIYSRMFRKENVVISDQSLQIGITVNPITNNILCGGIGTTRQDFLYGSFRAYMKSTAVNGTVAGMFMYHPEGEIDIELLSSVRPYQAYFAMHPGLTENNGKASNLTHGSYIYDSFDPTVDYHEYRFDWFPNLTIFYVDNKEVYRMTTNILSKPSRFMFNHWTDGNAKFSHGPAKENAYLNIKNMTFFFNSSDPLITTPKCVSVQSTCNIQNILGALKNGNTTFDTSYLTGGDNNNTTTTTSPIVSSTGAFATTTTTSSSATTTIYSTTYTICLILTFMISFYLI